MAGQPIHRKILSCSDPELFAIATEVPLFPKKDRTVFYAEDEGDRLAKKWIGANNDYTRLDDLLAQTPQGRNLLSRLKKPGWAWPQIEKVLWQLSWRLARAAAGTVRVFGPARFIQDRPLEEFRHKYSTGSFANTVFEIVELQELVENPRVTSILQWATVRIGRALTRATAELQINRAKHCLDSRVHFTRSFLAIHTVSSSCAIPASTQRCPDLTKISSKAFRSL